MSVYERYGLTKVINAQASTVLGLPNAAQP